MTGNIDLKDQHLSIDTLNILAVINYKFWVKDQEHKKWLLNKYKANGDLRKNMNVKPFFVNKNYDIDPKSVSQLPVVKKDSLINKIINFIKNLFI